MSSEEDQKFIIIPTGDLFGSPVTLFIPFFLFKCRGVHFSAGKGAEPGANSQTQHPSFNVKRASASRYIFPKFLTDVPKISAKASRGSSRFPMFSPDFHGLRQGLPCSLQIFAGFSKPLQDSRQVFKLLSNVSGPSAKLRPSAGFVPKHIQNLDTPDLDMPSAFHPERFVCPADHSPHRLPAVPLHIHIG